MCLLFVLLFSFSSQQALALPIDFHGEFGVDTTLIDSYRRVDNTTVNSTNSGTQEVGLAGGGQSNASFQTYIFRLNPTIVVNDGISIKGELSTGYGRGGFLGDDSRSVREANNSNILYYHNTSSNSQSISFVQTYMELYTDTGTLLLGRHSDHWGKGLIINDGKEIWSRHATIRDGATLKLKIGNFHLSPFLGKLAVSDSLTKATKMKEYGASLLYDNLDRDLKIGLYYSKRENSSFNTTVTSDINGTGSRPMGRSEVKITDVYFEKDFNRINVSAEIPMMSGNMGNLYSATETAKYSAKGFVLGATYTTESNNQFYTLFGSASGATGSTASFDALYLNPNFQIANLLFRYNLRAISSPSTINLFDSHVTNAKFIKFGYDFTSNKTTYSPSIIWAKANQTATAGSPAYNHSTNKAFNATTTQADDLGIEIDFNMKYKWNQEVTMGLNTAYLFTGDYYGYTNQAATNQTKNSYMVQFSANVSF